MNEWVYVVVLPAACATAMLCAGRRSLRWPLMWSGVAVCGGYLIAHVGLFGWPTWPISPARHGVAIAAIVGLAGGALIAMTRWKWWGNAAVRAACVAIGMGLVGWKRFIIERGWSGAEAGEWALMLIGAVVMWSVLDALAQKRGQRDVPAAECWFVSAASIGLSAPIVVIVGAAMGEGQALGALAVTLAVGAVLGMTRWGSPIGAAGIGAAAMIASTMWIAAAMWASLPWWMAVGFCAAPGAALVGDVPWMRSRRAWARVVARVAAVGAVVAAVGGQGQ